jgi:hypothetical protein
MISSTSIFQLGYHVVKLRLLAGDGGEGELSLSLGEPHSGPFGPERWKAHRRNVDVSSLRVVRILLQDHAGWSPMWDTVGLSTMNNYSTPAVTIFIMRRVLVQCDISGRNIQ